MAITLRGLIEFAAQHCRRTRWDHHFDVAMLRDCFVGWGAIIRTISRHADNWAVNLIEQRCHL